METRNWVAGIILASLSAAMPFNEVQADYFDNDPIMLLNASATELDQLVQESDLSDEAKGASSQFSYETQSLITCSATGDCSGKAVSLLNAWYPVEQSLAHVEYSLPTVFQKYVETRNLLDVVVSQIGGDVPEEPLLFSVRGSINYRQFVFSGPHRLAVEQECLRFGRREGIVLIRNLVINDRKLHRFPSRIERVCALIAENARGVE
jgi:hypothetical protein